jgi:predicted phage-related endonuclease
VLFLYWPDGDEQLIVEVARDEAMLESMRQIGERFWRQVTDGVPPEPLKPQDPRCQRCVFRHTCQGQAILDAVPAEERDGEVERSDDPALLALVQAEREASALADEAEAVREVCRERLRQALWHKKAIEVPGYRLYFLPQKSLRLDTTRLRREQPELAARYQHEVVSRPLRVYAI